jgi:hypothetical protein
LASAGDLGQDVGVVDRNDRRPTGLSGLFENLPVTDDEHNGDHNHHQKEPYAETGHGPGCDRARSIVLQQQCWNH